MLTEAAEQIAEINTPYQKAVIAYLPRYGKCLFLDDDIQSAESDQDLYHSILVNPAFVYNPNIRTALVLGGGEGATARKVLNHPSIQTVAMVDIDREVVALCQKYLSEWSQGAFDDPRLTIHYQDASEFIKLSHQPYDLIIWDLTDPFRWQDHQLTPSARLYCKETFADLEQLLTSQGLISVQYAARNSRIMTKLIQSWTRLHKRVVYIPSFQEKWVFAMYNSGHNND